MPPKAPAKPVKKTAKPKAVMSSKPGKKRVLPPKLKAAAPAAPTTAEVLAQAVTAKVTAKLDTAPPAPPPAPAAPAAAANAAPPLPPAPEGYVNVFVDGALLQVKKGSTVMSACTQAGKEIPHFCYHERLSIAGNCRMCLVEIEGMPKPVASCHWPVAEGNKIRTDSKLTIEARKGTMEIMLANHPLDCPICDQGGECDLQDQAMAYGNDVGHYHEAKRAVDDKNIGAKIKTVMTRCIHCTRCIRFATEVAGVEEMGATFRGENMQVGTYVEAALQSELAGNMIDLCPVGALTSKPHAFTLRPWELVSTPAFDILDGTGAAILVQSRAGQVMRVLPRENNAINEEWITDACRFSTDALGHNRLTTPLHKGQPLGWAETLDKLAAALSKSKKAGGLIGNLQGLEEAYAMREFFRHVLGSTLLGSAPASWPVTSAGWLRGYTPYSRWAEADAVLLIGADVQREAPLLNLRLRRLAKRKIPFFGIGTDSSASPALPLRTFPVDSLTTKSPLRDSFASAKSPLCIIGRGVLEHPDAAAILSAAHALVQRENWNGFNVLTPTGGTLAPLALGFDDTPQVLESLHKNALDVLFIHGERDDITPQMFKKFKGISIYLGTHATPLAQACTWQLPTTAWPEKSFTSINMQGDVQVSTQAVLPPHQAKEDWKIYRALSETLKKTLPFNCLSQIREQVGAPEFKCPALKAAKPGKAPVVPVQVKYYLQNSYLQQSATMHACQAESLAPTAQKAANLPEATHA